ncbi:hypothetical protein Tco_0599487 [Tanacetum coccineum]
MDFILVHNHIIQLVSTYRGRAYVEIVYAGYLLGVNVSCSLGSDGIGIVSLDILDFVILTYILAVATIWIAASFVVQSVVDGGVSPFLITYICNSLFVIYLPLVEIGRYIEDKYGSLLFWRSRDDSSSPRTQESEAITLLVEKDEVAQTIGLDIGTVTDEAVEDDDDDDDVALETNVVLDQHAIGYATGELDSKGRWTRTRLAKVSLLICPFWFLAQLSFNLSLKYTTVTTRMMMPKLKVSMGPVSCCLCFNLLIFAPIAFILHLANLEPFDTISRKQFGLIVGKELVNCALERSCFTHYYNVGTSERTIQVPLSPQASVDTGIEMHQVYGFILELRSQVDLLASNIPSDTCFNPERAALEL